MFRDNLPVAPARVVALLFLRLGLTAFGGPAAHIALMHYEVVRRRRWLSDEEFAELLAVTNLLPGPNSTEMAIHVGLRVAGWPGFLLAGLCFILPAALLVSGLAALYVRHGSTPDATALLAGIVPVVLAIIVQASFTLGRSALRGSFAVVLAIASAVLALAGVGEIAILALAGLLSIGVARALPLASAALLVQAAAAQAAAAAAAPVPLSLLTASFLKVGSLLFGSGYVLVAFLRTDFVERYGWITDRQLLDAIAAGQMTPGPLFTTATFIGYLLRGPAGALIATVAIFLPAFVFVALAQKALPVLRRTPAFVQALRGVLAASLGILAAVGVSLAAASLETPVQIATFAAALAILLCWRVNSLWLVLAGAVVGLLG